MKIDTVEIAQLKPAEYNPRYINASEFEQLKESLRRFGIVDPIIVNSNPERHNTVIGGHMRIRAAYELGIREVPVHYVDLTLERERELNIRLNKNTGKFDYDILSNSFNPDELIEWGFTEEELGMDVADKEELKPPVDKVDKNLVCPVCGHIGKDSEFTL